jgi:alpha,alpha-trehalose phosphorylase
VKAGDTYAVEPWCLRETRLELDDLARSESLFALSNGHIGLRGNLDEGEPFGLPGTYLNGCYERRPLPYAEAGYGYPESGQTVINVTNGKIMRLLVGDEPFDLRYGTLRAHERTLDFRTGVLQRCVEWVSPAGQAVQLRTQRLVSFTHRAVAAIRYELQPLDTASRLVVQSELVANEELPRPHADPRVAAVLASPLVPEASDVRALSAELVHRTRLSGLRVAAAMDHLVDTPSQVSTDTTHDDDWARTTFATRLEPGQVLCIDKVMAWGWSQARSLPAMRDQVAGALSGAMHSGWTGLAREQREHLDQFWECADVQIEGDAELQQAVRFSLFHVLQSAARAERRPIPAKGLTGPGYDGHCFWDTETFVLPVLTHTVPHATADVLRWRQDTLPLARERARQLTLRGAAFPWRTINGEECSSYWPAGTAAFHVNADIADAVVRYLAATEDEEFEHDTGLELLVETARLWRSLGHRTLEGRFRIDGITGPDEYSAVADNNVYTNLMAARNLRAAAGAAARHPRHAARLGVDADEVAAWRDAAANVIVPWDEVLGVHPQSEAFTAHERWNFDDTPPENYPLLLHYPYFDLYRKQVVKQADLVLALHLCGDQFTSEQKRRDFDYYEGLTVRDSSLSACTQSIVAAEVGHLGLAYDYAAEAAFMDLHDLEHNTRDGLHMAALAGAWLTLVHGFGGMRDHGQHLAFRPQLPEGIDRLTFGVARGASRLRVDVMPQEVAYTLMAGPGPLTIAHQDESLTLVVGDTVARPIGRRPRHPRPQQPPGRAPVRRRTQDPSTHE